VSLHSLIFIAEGGTSPALNRVRPKLEAQFSLTVLDRRDLSQLFSRKIENPDVVLLDETVHPRAPLLAQLRTFVPETKLAVLSNDKGVSNDLKPFEPVIVSQADKDLVEVLASAAKAVRQRRRFRTTLKHLNSRLSDGNLPHRKKVISDQFLTSVLTHADEAIFVIDAIGDVATWNSGAVSLFNKAEKDAIGSPARFLAGGEWCAALPEIIRRLESKNAVVKCQLTCSVANSGTQIFECTFSAIREHEQLSAVSAIIRNVSSRVAAERTTRETAERLQLALEAGHLGDWTWEAHTDLVRLSPRAAAIFGLPQDVPITWAAMRNLLHEEDRDRARLAVEEALHTHSTTPSSIA